METFDDYAANDYTGVVEEATQRERQRIMEELVGPLVEALEKRCRLHHLPLHNGWAHIYTPYRAQRKTTRCALTESERAALSAARKAMEKS